MGALTCLATCMSLLLKQLMRPKHSKINWKFFLCGPHLFWLHWLKKRWWTPKQACWILWWMPIGQFYSPKLDQLSRSCWWQSLLHSRRSQWIQWPSSARSNLSALNSPLTPKLPRWHTQLQPWKQPQTPPPNLPNPPHSKAMLWGPGWLSGWTLRTDIHSTYTNDVITYYKT